MRKCTTRVGKVKQRAPRGSHLEPKGCPKGAKRVPRGCQKGTKASPKATKIHPRTDYWESLRKARSRDPPGIYFPIHFGSNFSSKTDEQTNAKFHVVKVWEIVRKCSQNDANMRSKINGKSMIFQNLRFLVFCEEYNVKIVFLHDQGYQKSIKNL